MRDERMRTNDPDTQSRVKQYFRVKSRQLMASAQLPVCEHPGLVGGHREELQRIYLREILPKRFEVGRGMVYGPEQRSREADIVVWDSQNYPSLPMLDHSLFFVESVRLVLECKSAWTADEFEDVLQKCRSVHNIVIRPGLSLSDQVDMLRLELAASRQGVSQELVMMLPYRVGTAAIFLKGGGSLKQDQLSHELLEQADDCWPDLALLLEQGRLVVKNYQPSASPDRLAGEGWLEFYDLGEDALLAFTVGLFAFLEERSTQTEVPLNLTAYASYLISVDPTSQVDFPVKHIPSRRMHLWRLAEGDQDKLVITKRR